MKAIPRREIRMCKEAVRWEKAKRVGIKRKPVEHWKTGGRIQDRASEPMLRSFVCTLRAMGSH